MVGGGSVRAPSAYVAHESSNASPSPPTVRPPPLLLSTGLSPQQQQSSYVFSDVHNDYFSAVTQLQREEQELLEEGETMVHSPRSPSLDKNIPSEVKQ